MRRMEPWNNTVKIYHYMEFMDTISNIIDSTSLQTKATDRDIIIPKLQRMKNRTFYIRNTQPELARGIRIIADCLIDLYSNPSLLNDFYALTIYVISSRFYFILRYKKGEERQRQLEDLKLQVEEQNLSHKQHSQNSSTTYSTCRPPYKQKEQSSTPPQQENIHNTIWQNKSHNQQLKTGSTNTASTGATYQPYLTY